MLADFIASIMEGKISEADQLAIEMIEIAEAIAEKVALRQEEKSWGQDAIMDAMRKTFSSGFSRLDSLQEAQKIRDRVYDWETRSQEKLHKIAAMQDYMLNELTRRIHEMEINSLVRICDTYNEALCVDHSKALDKSKNNPEKLEETSYAVTERTMAFLRLYHILDDKKPHEEKIAAFIHGLADFRQILLQFPIEETTKGMFQRFSWQLWQLGKFSCLKNRDLCQNFTTFTNNVHNVFEDFRKSPMRP